jgi:hypothetical protein
MTSPRQRNKWAEKFGAPLERWADTNIGATESDDLVVVKTTRYLRLSMMGLVIGLSAAVLYAHFAPHADGGVSGNCWQKSISAYYYTPAHSFFVAALIAIGISLIALKGSTEIEDVLLNFAGMFAPVVAFVPTPNTGSCGTVIDATDRNLNIANNVTAMLIMAGVALVALAALWLHGTSINEVPSRDEPQSPVQQAQERRAQAIQTGGYLAALVLYVLAWFSFKGEETWFRDNAHSFSAVIFFVFIFLAVLDNAIDFHFARKKMVGKQQDRATAADVDIPTADKVKPPRPVNRYLAIAILMVAAPIIIKEAPWFGDYETIWLEATMIALFAIFWVLQTHELWHRGLRTLDLPPVTDPGGEPVRT